MSIGKWRPWISFPKESKSPRLGALSARYDGIEGGAMHSDADVNWGSVELLKPFFQFAAVAGILLALAADFAFKAKKIRVTSLALAVLAAIGVWAIELFLRFPISAASGTATLLFQWEGAGMEGKRTGPLNESTVEVFRNDTCILKMGSSRTSASGLEQGITVFKNDYSMPDPGSHAYTDIADLNEIDSIVIFNPDFNWAVELIDGRLDLRLNGNNYYRIGIDRKSYENKRVKIPWEVLERLRINPEGKTDFGRLTMGDKKIAGSWIGSGSIPDSRLTVTAILAVDLKENHTYSAEFTVYAQPLGILNTNYTESGFWKAEKGGIRVLPKNCRELTHHFYRSGLERIPCDRKHAMAFQYSGDSLNIGMLSDGIPMKFPMHRL